MMKRPSDPKRQAFRQLLQGKLSSQQLRQELKPETQSPSPIVWQGETSYGGIEWVSVINSVPQ